jgi:rubrerythrin
MAETKLVCPFCGKEYDSKLGLSKHLKVCESKPDEDEHDETPENLDAGIALFDDGEGNTYECPECGYTAKRAFNKCPKCGEGLEW